MLHLLLFPAPCWKFDFAEIKINRVFERKEQRVYKALHLGDTLNLSSTIGLAFTKAPKPSYISVVLLNFVMKINYRHFFGGRSHAKKLAKLNQNHDRDWNILNAELKKNPNNFLLRD